MNFLDLCQRLRQEAGISGTGPIAVTNQSGEYKRVVDWVQTAYEDIQNAHDTWRWMRRKANISTSAGTRNYGYAAFMDLTDSAPISRFNYWYTDVASIYLTATGVSDEQQLTFIPYDDWRIVYDIGNNISEQDRPSFYTVSPTDEILLAKVPNDIYVVRNDYQMSPGTLANENSVPDMPLQYHMIIVWRALMFYGGYEGASEVYARGQTEYNRLFSRMERTQLPGMGFGEPLVE